MMETPPRAWGRPGALCAGVPRPGNTPTGVGKTSTGCLIGGWREKHPHGRGEDARSGFMRGHDRRNAQSRCRNTPTGVGKTQCATANRRSARKHPHGRGEDPHAARGSSPKRETPPRAWGRLPPAAEEEAEGGNTPTGVGKTAPSPFARRLSGKHPHGRGEDSSTIGKRPLGPETPPRAWGRQHLRHSLDAFPGNTPTGVGKTKDQRANQSVFEKHPHGRGEDAPSSGSLRRGSETPPRAWGRPAR